MDLPSGLHRPPGAGRAPRLSSPVVAGVAFGMGLVVLPVGVGLALPHLSKTGLALTGAFGALALVVGLLLVVGGAFAVVRSVSRWWRVLVVPALFALVVVSLYTLGQAVAFTHVPRTAVGAETPADRGLAYRDVTFPSRDGVTLSGWYLPSTNGAAVVLLHGAGSTRSGVLDHAVVLARHGYGVLAFDARGHGRSEGRAMDAGWWGDDEIAGALSFLEGQPDVDASRLAGVGMSMGGEEVLGAGATDERLRGVVAEGAGQRVAADKRWQSQEYGWRGQVQEQIDRLEFALVDLFTDAPTPASLRASVAAMAPRPALLIAGGAADEESTVADYIASASPATVEVWTVPGAGHTQGLATEPAAWEERVVGFLDRVTASGDRPTP